MSKLFLGTREVTPVMGGGSDGFAETFGENIYHLMDNKDSNGLIPFFTQDEMKIVFNGIKNIPPYWCNNLLQNSPVTEVSFPDLIKVSGNHGLTDSLKSCSNLVRVSFPNLITIDGGYALSTFAWYCTELVEVDFPSLTTVNGIDGLYYCFNKCTKLATISFPNLSVVTASEALRYCFAHVTALKDVYFNSLNTSSFGTFTDQFNSMMYNTGSTVIHTLHFPSNLESTISGLDGYPLFGGTSGYVVLAYDLPATS